MSTVVPVKYVVAQDKAKCNIDCYLHVQLFFNCTQIYVIIPTNQVTLPMTPNPYHCVLIKGHILILLFLCMLVVTVHSEFTYN